jgi:hypothetical protein
MGYWGGGVGACCAIPPRATARRFRRESARPCARAHTHTHAHTHSLTQTSTAAWRPCGGPSIKSCSTASRIAISICPYEKSVVGAGQQTQKASTGVSFTLALLPALPAPLACSRSRSHARAHTHMHGYTHLGLNVRNGSGVQRAFILRCMPQTRLRKRDGTAHAAQRKMLGAPTGEEPRDARILQLRLHPFPQR